MTSHPDGLRDHDHPSQPDPLTHLLNEMARRRLDPAELDTLRAAVHEAVRPVVGQLPDTAAAEQETWARLLDHFPGTDPAAEPIADGAGYVRQIADAVRVAHAPRGPAGTTRPAAHSAPVPPHTTAPP